VTSGRLLIPCDNKVAGTKVRQSHVIYSDDHGASWKIGGVVGPQCNESQIVELVDGRLMLNMRSYEANQRRLIATSLNGGLGWSPPKEDGALIEPVCQASIVRFSGLKTGERNILLFSNPASMKREKMTIRASYDDGTTWPVARLLHDGPAAYSCLTRLPDGQVGCLYERGTKSPYETITFARFPLEWIEAGERGRESFLGRMSHWTFEQILSSAQKRLPTPLGRTMATTNTCLTCLMNN
jgi:sialidase-1